MDITQMLEELNIQKAMDKAQEKLKSVTAEGESGGGAVRIRMNGLCHVLSVELDDNLLALQSKEALCDLLVAAFNFARKKVEGETQAIGIANLLEMLPEMLRGNTEDK